MPDSHKAAQLVDSILNEELKVQREARQRIRVDPHTVSRIVARVEMGGLDDVEDVEDYDEMAENCWTLCIDQANGIIGQGEEAIAIAKAACVELGYPRPGWRAPRRKGPGPALWPPRVAGKPASASEESPESPVKPTGVHHGSHRPPYNESVVQEVKLAAAFGGGDDEPESPANDQSFTDEWEQESMWYNLANENGISDDDLKETARKYGLVEPFKAIDDAYAKAGHEYPRRSAWSGETVWLYLTLRDRKLVDKTGQPIA